MIARFSKGFLDTKMNTNSLAGKWKDLKRAVKLECNYQFSPKENKEILEFIDKQLPSLEGVSTKARPKLIANLKVTEDLVIFLWKSDEYQYKHPRIRMQIVFLILIFSLLGSRPGELVESEAWVASNEGICYKDVELV
ncbi:hypothetical protein GQ43DRAFT_486811 [Delitschia confertaspora ATCC 74209]|uniref:Uncharacterized protein n=1 Tax=Delitschia confertaspora ATCC 74209 TaxID=1513339 RepID=A0A9P4JS87_9PLEO|nr:hypothetical protein GQ43DRAFT_486811 [Delitschia confertaspora ATCC 74209]